MWELVEFDEENSFYTERLRVRDGWIYCRAMLGMAAMCFVPARSLIENVTAAHDSD